MTMKTDAVEAVDRYLRAGGSVCPYARKAIIRYAMDNEALGPMLIAFERSEACVVIASTALNGFLDVKRWAQDTALSTFVAATSLAYPRLSRRQVKERIRTDTEPALRSDARSAPAVPSSQGAAAPAHRRRADETCALHFVMIIEPVAPVPDGRWVLGEDDLGTRVLA
jgi:hypothetical protein